MTDTLSEFTVRGWLCDSAAVADGKLYVQGGGWDVLNPVGYPAVVARIGIAMTVHVPYMRANEPHALTITLEDEDGRMLGLSPDHTDPTSPDSAPRPGRLEAQFTVGRPPFLCPGDAQVVQFAMNIDGMPLMTPGAYTFVVAIDGTEVERLTFRALAPAMAV